MLETGSSQIVTEARPQSTPVDAHARGRRTEQRGSADGRGGSPGRSDRRIRRRPHPGSRSRSVTFWRHWAV